MAFIMNLEGTPKDILKQAEDAAVKYLKDVPDADKEGVMAALGNIKKHVSNIAPDKVVKLQTNGRAILVHG